MGLLDDAIREHLDLKRRRGADPTEVERAEREALGPVRRGPDPEPAEGPGAGAPAYDMEAEHEWQEPLEGSARDSAAPPEFDRHYEPPASFERAAPPLTDEHSLTDEPPPRDAAPRDQPPDPSRSRNFSTDDPLAEDPFAGDDHPGTPRPHQAPASAAPRQAEPAGGETVEYRIDEAHEGEHETKDEDVLEETPEFLQDTPDHDRLWFEQRPPKDFDFEG
jgi:hypothetical protein